MSVIENLAIIHWVVPLLLVPNGVGVGFEIDRTACVLHIFENVSNGAFVPAVFILRCLMRCLSALTLFVCGGIQNLFLFEQCCDLARSLALHTERKNPFYDFCRFFINCTSLRIIGICLVAIRNVGSQTLALLTLCFIDRTDFAAGNYTRRCAAS